MQGSVILDFGKGWACSNEANIMVNRQIVTDDGGKKQSKHTDQVRVLFYHNVVGRMEKDMVAEAVFKMDSSGTEKGFKVKIVGLTDEMAILDVIEQIENYKLITKTIKRRYNYGK